MKKIIFCITVSLLCFSYPVQAQYHGVTPEIKAWAEKNRDWIAAMTRSEWQELYEDCKGFVLFSLSPQKIHEFYVQKTEQVRDSFEWSKAEREHIDRLWQYLTDNPDLYSPGRDEKKMAEYKDFLKKWSKQAREKLGWTDRLIRGIAYNCSDLLDKKGNVLVTETSN